MTMATWLVTGGAGYIGSHTVRALIDGGYDVVVVDDLSTGRIERLDSGIPVFIASLSDRRRVADILRSHRVHGVLHFAAKKSAPESLVRPIDYFRENVGNLIELMQAMVDADVSRLVYSSSAAVYGIREGGLLAEEHPTSPINPYGQSKLVGERLIEMAVRAHGLSSISLRYFNVAGAASQRLADHGGTSVMPIVFAAARSGVPLTIHGADHPTPDGTPVRDYIDVVDLADAHVAAVRRLVAGACCEVYNVGTGVGHSVRDLISAVEQVAGVQVPHVIGPRRSGDPSIAVAAVDKIKVDLNWSAQQSFQSTVAAAWEASARMEAGGLVAGAL